MKISDLVQIMEKDVEFLKDKEEQLSSVEAAKLVDFIKVFFLIEKEMNKNKDKDNKDEEAVEEEILKAAEAILEQRKQK